MGMLRSEVRSRIEENKGWPVGKYKIDIYDGDELATTVKFTTKAAGKSEEESED